MPDSKESLAVQRWVLPILVLPLNILVFIPAFVLRLTGWSWTPNHPALAMLGCVFLLSGLGVSAWTVSLFHFHGRGTAAPWDPPRRLVVSGPYRHVRNPMLCSVFAMQAAEALLLNSWAVAVLLVLFVFANMLYFPLVEEKALDKRFGAAYREYRQNVPRWVPRLRPWSNAQNGRGSGDAEKIF